MLYEGTLIGTNLKIAIVVARFNDFINQQLQAGCRDGLMRHGVLEKNIDIVKVPGAFELSLAAQKLAQIDKYDAIIALGTIIRGATSHYDLVCNETAKGLAHVGLHYNIPVLFGVLTTDTIEQAIERAGTKSGNKGFDVAMSAIEMANVLNSIIKK